MNLGMTDVTIIVIMALTLLSLVFWKILAPFLGGKLSEAQLAVAHKIADIVCMAAEEAARTGIIPKGDKLEYAVGLFAQYLERWKLTFDEAEIVAFIKASVWHNMNQYKDSDKPGDEAE